MIGTSAVRASDRAIILLSACFPVEDVHFIIGNDYAGGRLKPLPKLINVPIAEYEPDWPKLIHMCFLLLLTLKQAQDTDFPDSLFSSASPFSKMTHDSNSYL